MSETRSQQEPSMEEILASIRRIISEDGQESQAAPGPQPQREKTAEPTRAPEPPPAPEPTRTPELKPAPGPKAAEAEAPRKPDPVRSEARPEAPRLRPAPNGESDVLVLTEMLAEDGSVVSLAGREAAAPARSPAAAQSPGEPDLPTEPDPEGLPEPPTEPENPAKAAPDEEPTNEEFPSQDPSSERPLDAAPAQRPAATAPPPSADQSKENETVTNEARKHLDIVSRQAESAATAAFAELARAVDRESDIHSGGRMVEDLVREALQPMLREWLDANLPALVERLVRAEIQRMVRRAEDGA